MTDDEHKSLARFIKEVHASLRESSSKIGVQKAWQDHCNNKEVLKTYAQCMNKLATTHWEKNCQSESSLATSRIKWGAEFCYDYFINESYLKYRKKELDISTKINIVIENEEDFTKPLKLIDVGSCYNPFKVYEYFDVLAIDLYPANDSVLECDFLDVSVGPVQIIQNKVMKQLQQSFFDVVVFCFLLEYIPTSDLRIIACQKAYHILKPGGLLIINTPDSKHVSANCKIIKCWQYTLSIIGFTRIKYEKFKHMHCMAFRKSLHKDTAVRWAKIYKEPYMEFSMHISQDSNNSTIEKSINVKIETSVEEFNELPFSELDY